MDILIFGDDIINIIFKIGWYPRELKNEDNKEFITVIKIVIISKKKETCFKTSFYVKLAGNDPSNSRFTNISHPV